MRMDWSRASLLAQGALFAYYQLIEWVDLFPWNDVRHGNGQESLDGILTVGLACLLLATWRRWRWSMAAGVVLYGLWLALQIDSWWVPYFQGASPEWKRTYLRFFSQTTRFLASDGVHLPPDACHVVLQLLLFVAFLTTAIATARLARRGRPD